MASTTAKTRVLTDHDQIQKWAEARDARPATVKRTAKSGDAGVLRLDFPGYTGEGSLKEISWDDWFAKFDESDLALIVQDKTASGRRSNFNKLVSRASAAVRPKKRAASSTTAGRRTRSGAPKKRATKRTTKRATSSGRARAARR